MEQARAARQTPDRTKEVEAVETMNNHTMAIVTPAHALGFDAPSRLRAFTSKRPGYTSAVATKHTWLDSIRLAPDSASGNPPA